MAAKEIGSETKQGCKCAEVISWITECVFSAFQFDNRILLLFLFFPFKTF